MLWLSAPLYTLSTSNVVQKDLTYPSSLSSVASSIWLTFKSPKILVLLLGGGMGFNVQRGDGSYLETFLHVKDGVGGTIWEASPLLGVKVCGGVQ